MRNRINKLLEDSEIDSSILTDLTITKNALSTINDTLLVEKEKKQIENQNDFTNINNNSKINTHQDNLNTFINDFVDIETFNEFKEKYNDNIDNINSSLDFYENTIIKNQDDIKNLNDKIIHISTIQILILIKLLTIIIY